MGLFNDGFDGINQLFAGFYINSGIFVRNGLLHSTERVVGYIFEFDTLKKYNIPIQLTISITGSDKDTFPHGFITIEHFLKSFLLYSRGCGYVDNTITTV